MSSRSLMGTPEWCKPAQQTAMHAMLDPRTCRCVKLSRRKSWIRQLGPGIVRVSVCRPSALRVKQHHLSPSLPYSLPGLLQAKCRCKGRRLRCAFEQDQTGGSPRFHILPWSSVLRLSINYQLLCFALISNTKF